MAVPTIIKYDEQGFRGLGVVDFILEHNVLENGKHTLGYFNHLAMEGLVCVIGDTKEECEVKLNEWLLRKRINKHIKTHKEL